MSAHRPLAPVRERADTEGLSQKRLPHWWAKDWMRDTGEGGTGGVALRRFPASDRVPFALGELAEVMRGKSAPPTSVNPRLEAGTEAAYRLKRKFSAGLKSR